MTDSLGADSHRPGLSVRSPCQQSGSGFKQRVCQFKITGIDINGYNPSPISGFDLRPNSLLIDLRAAPGQLLNRIPTLACCHGSSPHSQSHLGHLGL